MNYTKCLGHNCQFYKEKPDSICFIQGVLPKCSPNLKQQRVMLDLASPDMYETLKFIRSMKSDIQLYTALDGQTWLDIDNALDKAEGK